MAYRVIGQDAAITTILGAVANGATQTFSTGVDRKSLARRVMIDEEALDADVSALGDGLEKSRPRRTKATVKLELLVGSAGVLFAGKVGYAIKIHSAELSTNTGEDYVGYISKRSLEVPDGEQIETIEVKIGIEGWTYAGIYA